MDSYLPLQEKSSEMIYNGLEKMMISAAQQSELKKIVTALDEFAIVSITDRKGDIIFVNKEFCRVSKYSQNELIGQNHRILKSGYHSDAFFKGMWKTISSGLSGEV